MSEPTDADGQFPFDVSVSAATCDCGVVHPASTRCVCGEPRSFDEPLDLRRQMIRTAYEAVSSYDPVGVAGDLDALAWYPRLGDWYPAFLRGCQEVARGEGSAALTAALVELLTLQADAAATRRLRPSIAVWRSVDAALRSFVDAAHDFLLALTVADRDSAEAAGERGQGAIDRFSADLQELRRKRIRWEQLEEKVVGASGPFDPAILSVESARSDDGLVTITDLDTEGQRFVERVTGGSRLPGLGAGLAILDAHAEAFMDPDRVWRIARRTFSRLTAAGSGGLPVVAASASWRSDMNALNQELLDLDAEMQRALFDVPRRAARSFVRAGHLLTERIGKYLLATLLSSHGRDYEQLRDSDVGALLGEVAQIGLDDISLGWDKALRHGDAHGAFQGDDTGVRFAADKREYDFLTWDELGDRVLAAYESVLAVNVGLACALESLGLDLPDISALDVSTEDKVRFVLAMHGWSDTKVDLTGDRVRASGFVAELPAQMGFAASVSTQLPRDVVAATFEVTDGAVSQVWEGPLSCLRAFSAESSDLGKQLRLVELSRHWTLDGVPLQSPTWVRGTVASTSCPSMRSPRRSSWCWNLSPRRRAASVTGSSSRRWDEFVAATSH